MWRQRGTSEATVWIFNQACGSSVLEPGHVLRPQQGPAAALLALGALAFGAYPIVSHPADYRDILLPLRKKTRRRFRSFRLKKSL